MILSILYVLYLTWDLPGLPIVVWQTVERTHTLAESP